MASSGMTWSDGYCICCPMSRDNKTHNVLGVCGWPCTGDRIHMCNQLGASTTWVVGSASIHMGLRTRLSCPYTVFIYMSVITSDYGLVCFQSLTGFVVFGENSVQDLCPLLRQLCYFSTQFYKFFPYFYINLLPDKRFGNNFLILWAPYSVLILHFSWSLAHLFFVLFHVPLVSYTRNYSQIQFYKSFIL